jgi:nicotinate-nucleotide pyrophosphorylase (carboxylating)
VASVGDKLKVIQLKGEFASVAQEAIMAVTHGADILMVDTGGLADFEAARRALEAIGLRQQVKLAFAKGVRLRDIPAMKGRGIDILDIGSEIVDAPLLDMKLDVSVVPPCN